MRRRKILEAAIRVLAKSGPKGLTHRAVDAEAGLPVGSTSNVFRTRVLLVQGILSHLIKLDQEIIEQLFRQQMATNKKGYASVLAEFAQISATDLRDSSVARYALCFDSLAMPEDAAALAQARTQLVELGVAMLDPALGNAAPGIARLILAFLDGVILDSVVFGTTIDVVSVEHAILSIAHAPET